MYVYVCSKTSPTLSYNVRVFLNDFKKEKEAERRKITCLIFFNDLRSGKRNQTPKPSLDYPINTPLFIGSISRISIAGMPNTWHM